MARAPMPADEDKRLASVRALRLLGTPAEERFDQIVRLARKAFRLPFAAITLADGQRLWLKSADGADIIEGVRSDSYCQWTIAETGRKPMVIEDAKQDARTADSPYADTFRFYAGMPVHHQDVPVGTFCVGGPTPRTMSDDELEILADLATMVEDQFVARQLSETQLEIAEELRKSREQASVDALTRVWNRPAILEIAVRELAKQRTGYLMLDVDHFKRVNDVHGHQAGDEVLRRVSERIRKNIRGVDAVGRYGGEEFLIVLPGCEQPDLERVAERIRFEISRTPIPVGEAELAITASLGGAIGSDPKHFTDLVIRGADEALLFAKSHGRNRVCTRVITQSLEMRAVSLRDSERR